MSDARAVVEQFFRAGVTSDRKGRADLFTEDGVVEFPFAPAGMTNRYQGREAIKWLFTTLGSRADEANLKIDEAASTMTLHETTDPEVVIAELDLQVDADTRLPYIQVFHVRNGQISVFRDYWGPITADFTASSLG